jgi:Trp operon repressor
MTPREALATLDRLLATCDTADERRELLADLLTEAELVDLAQRWEIVRRVLEGIPQRTVQREVGVSISLVTRASNALKARGKGFRRAFRRFASDDAPKAR